MKGLAAFLATLSVIAFSQIYGQGAGEVSPSPSPESTKPEKKEKSAAEQFLGGDARPKGPITTEIYADEAFFDSGKSTGIFSGHVKVVDPRFSLQADKLTVYIKKGEAKGLEKALAEGNVAVVRDRPDPSGGPSGRAVGRSEKAIYNAASGNVELTGTPRVQQGFNTHIATSPETVMIINQNGQLTTHGPSRTDIRQDPKDEKGEKGEKGDKKKKGEKESD